MSDENLEVLEDDSEDLQEFKASMGDPSTVADPVSTKDSSRPADKDAGEKKPVAQGNSPKTKVGMINAMMTRMHGMKKEDLYAAYSKMMGEETEANEEDIVEDIEASEPITVTRDDIDLEDDVKALFGNEDLSEEFKNKATTIFEAAVITKINEKLSELSEKIEADNLVESQKSHEDMVEKMDSYLDYVVEQWADENRLAMENGIRTEIAEEFIGGLKKLFEESYIDIPEDKVDVLGDLSDQVDELEESLNKELAKNVELNDKIEVLIKDSVVSEISEDLTDANKEKFNDLASAVEFVSEEDYRGKVSMIKESYFADEDKIESIIDEEEPLEEEVRKNVTGSMAHYAAAISRTVKK
jgi:hypothetical protein